MATAELQGSASTTREGSILDDVLAKQMGQRADLLQMRMENETIMSECRVHPRDMAAIKFELSQLLKTFPDFADEAIYSKNVGGGKMAEDLSIRAAEALAEAYGYNRVRADVTELDADTVKIDATFTDFQSGRIWQDGAIVSKFYTASRDKGGGRVRHADDRFYDTVVKAAKSKIIREVILRSINSALKAWFKNECYKVMAQTITPEKEAETVQAWKTIGVGLEKLEQLIGKPKSMGWLSQDVARLRSMYTAIRDKETTIEALLDKNLPAQESSQADIDKELADKAAKKPGKGKQQTFTPAEEAAIIAAEKGDAFEG